MRNNSIACLALALLVTGGTSAAAAGAAPTPVFVRGSVASFTSTAMSITTPSGVRVVSYVAKTMFVGADRGSLGDVVPGAFLGIANVPGNGVSRALEVSVFDEKLRGVGEGDRPWQAAAVRGSMMTNGTVAPLKAAAMTNGTVGAMTTGDTKTITVNYKGGARKIVITKATPIVRVSPGSSKLLTPNAGVFVSARKTPAGLVADFVVVGKNGTPVPL